PSTPDAVATELAEVEAAIAATERAGPPLADRHLQLDNELGEAERLFKAHGLQPVGITPHEVTHNFRRALRGAFAILDRHAGGVLLEAERTRIADHFDAAGALGLSPEERDRRLAQLQQRRRMLLAQRERQLRASEGEELVVDGRRDAEMFVLDEASL